MEAGTFVGKWEVITTSDAPISAEEVRTKFNTSLQPGNSNAHLGNKYFVCDVKVVDQRTDECYDYYKAPMFETV